MSASCRLADEHTLEELVEIEKAATEANRESPSKARSKRVDDVRWAIYYKTSEMRKERGDPVSMEGYSGRQTKRR